MKPTFNISPGKKNNLNFITRKSDRSKIKPIPYGLMELFASPRLLQRRAGHFANLAAAECRAFGGAGNGVRTRDPKLGKLVLYQLSYARPQAHTAIGQIYLFCLTCQVR